MSVLSTTQLTVGYAPPRRPVVPVASGLNLSTGRGQMVCLLGPNGAGKSTLLRTLAGLQRPLAGQVSLNGRDLFAMSAMDRAREVAVVLTERIMPGLLTGWALVALGRSPHTGFMGSLTSADETAVKEAVALVGAEDLAPRPVAELSDGERQKFLIARAIAQGSPLILLDEPTAYLDALRRVEILELLRRLTRDTGRTIIASTHEVHLAHELADMLWLMDGRGGLAFGTPDELAHSGEFARTFPTLVRR